MNRDVWIARTFQVVFVVLLFVIHGLSGDARPGVGARLAVADA